MIAREDEVNRKKNDEGKKVRGFFKNCFFKKIAVYFIAFYKGCQKTQNRIKVIMCLNTYSLTQSKHMFKSHWFNEVSLNYLDEIHRFHCGGVL